ncbi:hydantoinase/oxoprolinase family protein [Pseudaminobacter arsenicus]|uniref:Hydantoinase/oxoprolinase family protein n=1 Tax=Borborobacter arsenicus TaxID=1851146 RepID=A0A432V7X9_9HYPH|nr:hydantoinase/oxoprolinase family protein [Pseudaminobacter arsenicus]RUM98268.1 hydantoinase/oxoprolinase family protein [Pseudaminobacter arsenicus]
MRILEPVRDVAPSPLASCQIGVDVGGTFTDLVLIDGCGAVRCVKVPSTPGEPALSTLQGIDELIGPAGARQFQSIHHTHSNTLALNTLIERTGANIGMLVTQGFRDLMEIQRLSIPDPMRYSSRRPQAVVPRRLVREVRERLNADGSIETPLDASQLLEAAAEIVAAGAQGIVICFLHSYRSPVHERRAREIIGEKFPDLPVDISSEVWPQAREFERGMLATINSYVRPRIERYVTVLAQGLLSRSISSAPRGARSNGGRELLSSMGQKPAVALFSGPAAGVAGAASVALDAGWADADLMTLDIGGTSADIGVIRRGKPILSSEEHIADFPILFPTVAVSAIGAGGGSIIWADPTGSVKVGPRSVGADPGPACYGRSDALVPALTDAFLVVGYLSADRKLGDKLVMSLERSLQAMSRLGDRVGVPAEGIADGAIQIAIAMMAAEATSTLSRRGVDAPEFRMVAYGGAGPLLGALVAEEVFIDTVLIPPLPGALSAMGAARSDIHGDFLRPIYQEVEIIDPTQFASQLDSISRDARDWLGEEVEGLPVTGMNITYSLDMRYEGQGFDVAVDIDRETLERFDRSVLLKRFHDAHQAEFGYASESARVWIKELRAHAVGYLAKTVHAHKGAEAAQPCAPRARTIRLRGAAVHASVYSRENLEIGSRLEGPAIIEQMDTTTLIPDGWICECHQSGALVLHRAG